ncbi:MAG TPA: Gfo/Idh/MocA family oxidoreductase [Planctomycetota bacterium]|nr:Gfo/Idh/MocA family oxidoreductase [Planctomycetota bacterium]HRR80432.1 Gfo/Idh/MocA family oxidoreductase [Planctomycetota bacterium]HRT94122.1 Gfo/Idh/MocA family oxidoreductase [Planctomycetota bacterium]
MKKVKVGIIGCGNISGNYLHWARQLGVFDVAALADQVPERAQAKAAEHGLRACSVADLLADPEIEIVVNLTVPRAHAAVNLAALKAGKHAYCEKPFAVTREEGRKVLAAAKKAGRLVGGAPDTFLGGGIQTCRKLIDDGAIGEPVGATAFMACRGHESWHPDPEFYYDLGGGPMLDMGPYYLTALVNLLGPVKRVSGSARISFPERLITSEPKNGTRIQVKTPTHIAGTLDFASGAIGTVVMSFDVVAHRLPIIEIYGAEGTLLVPDPNGFGGPVRIRRRGDADWTEVRLTHSDQVGRSMGVADMAQAIALGRKPRASGELCYHVLDVMLAFEDASKSGQHVAIQSPCERPPALPTPELRFDA